MCLNVRVHCGYTVCVCSSTVNSIVSIYVCLHVVRGVLDALMLDERRIPPSLCIIMWSFLLPN